MKVFVKDLFLFGGMPMDMKQLTTFVTLVRTLNYQKAADELQYAPSTLFKHIQLLEQELGTELLKKTGRQLQLTQEGQIFQGYARQSLEKYNQAMESIACRDEQGSAITIGGCEMNTANSLIHLLGAFSKAHPNVRMSMMTSPNAGVPALTKNDMIDLGFYYSVDDGAFSGVNMIRLYQEPVYLMVSEKHELAGKRDLHYEDLQDMEFVHPHDNCCFALELLPRLEKRGVQLGSVAYLGGVHLVVDHVRSRNAITMAPLCALERFKNTYGLVNLHMAEEPVLAWECLMYKHYENMKPIAKALIRHARSYAQTMLKNDETGLLRAPQTNV